MKLSELTTDQAADVLCEVTPYIANITGDKSLLDELGKKFDSKGRAWRSCIPMRQRNALFWPRCS